VPTIRQIAAVLYGTVDKPRKFVAAKIDPDKAATARAWLERFLHGDLDYSQMTPDLAVSLPSYRIAQLKEDGRLLGEPSGFELSGIDRRMPLTIYHYRVRFKSGFTHFIFTQNDAGKVAGFALEAWQ
jgi:hypothetical protein